jgi:hypothetical protein
MTMVALPAIALAITYGLGIDPIYRHPYWAYLNDAKRWCALNSDMFESIPAFDWTNHQPIPDPRGPGPIRLACLLKVEHFKVGLSQGLVGLSNDPWCAPTTHAVSLNGRSKMSRTVHNWAVQGGQATLSPAEVQDFAKLVARLPESQSWIPVGNVVLVGFLDRGAWSTRVYDKARLPPEVVSLIRGMRVDLD